MQHRTLTDEDIQAIATALEPYNSCKMGLTPEEVTTLKRFLKAFNGAANLVGGLILTAIVGGLFAIFTKGFWVSLLAGAKAIK